ncbi:lithostathine-1-beta-like [Sphaeramia orbicularis]|uniref:lithostathine-1-beta-like n=1 Tax=Sphaeramia orbicularis TaxID=375764 RepID=UPI00117DC8EA|nr:lithostathine-1-beta-like [Sphaeramia orbicularis]
MAFYFQEGPKTWIAALRHCREKSHDLVVITSENKKTDVKKCLEDQHNITNGVWIGLERSIFGCSVPWEWISGEECKNCDVQHRNSSHYCGKISSAGVFHSDYCFEELPFICEP